MDRETHFLKYLDKELTPEERVDVEKLLEHDAGARELYQRIERERNNVRNALDGLNPVDAVEIPAFIRPGSPVLSAGTFLRFAAVAVLFIGLAVTLWLLVYQGPVEEDAGMKAMHEGELETDALDCYISPNRCWNRRQIPLIVIEIN